MDTSVKATVRRMLIQYPSLYENKSDCFSHLFLSLGGGYDWIGGCLVDPVQNSRGNDEPRWADESGAPSRGEHVIDNDLIENHMREMRILHAKRENMLVKFALENFEAMFNQPVTFYNHFIWACCEQTPLFEMPEDVEPEWRDAADQASHALMVWLNVNERYYKSEVLEPVRVLNNAFRKQHFAEKDARLRELFRRVKEDKE